jgi:hypothetical protein
MEATRSARIKSEMHRSRRVAAVARNICRNSDD